MRRPQIVVSVAACLAISGLPAAVCHARCVPVSAGGTIAAIGDIQLRMAGCNDSIGRAGALVTVAFPEAIRTIGVCLSDLETFGFAPSSCVDLFECSPAMLLPSSRCEG